MRASAHPVWSLGERVRKVIAPIVLYATIAALCIAVALANSIDRGGLTPVLLALALLALMALFLYAIVYGRSIAAQVASGEDDLRLRAGQDPLSGLVNRSHFSERLERTVETVRKTGRSAAVFYIDLDEFKNVNDTHGHHVGDELIRSVAERLRAIEPDDGLVARLGGDEFAIVAHGPTDDATLLETAGTLIRSLSAPHRIAGHEIVIGASVGIACIDRTTTAIDALRCADIALYRAKNRGRNRACVYDAALDAEIRRRRKLENELRHALDADGLRLVYQTLVAPDGERIIGVEALCRWDHPAEGEIPPSTFIPVAEQSGLITRLGEWVLHRACLDARAWPGMLLAINVSPLQFRRPDFVDVVKAILEETGFDPNLLELELTEVTLLGSVEGADQIMRRLQALGIKISLDDFGTGYSSLLHLRTFPFDKIKIETSFVRAIESAADAAAVMHGIVSVGRGLGMKVIAEGVETAEQNLFLRAAGVHSMQGYRFGPPADAAAITARIAEQPHRAQARGSG